MQKLLITVIMVLCFLVKEANAMYFKKPVLFSEVTGIVMNKGVPLANVEVLRVLTGDDGNLSDNTYTDLSGRFYFEPIYRKRFRFFDLVPHEIVIGQKIIFKYQGNEYKGWFYAKRNYDNNGELRGKPISLICDLTNDFVDNEGGFKGICRLR